MGKRKGPGICPWSLLGWSPWTLHWEQQCLWNVGPVEWLLGPILQWLIFTNMHDRLAKIILYLIKFKKAHYSTLLRLTDWEASFLSSNASKGLWGPDHWWSIVRHQDIQSINCSSSCLLWKGGTYTKEPLNKSVIAFQQIAPSPNIVHIAYKYLKLSYTGPLNNRRFPRILQSYTLVNTFVVRLGLFQYFYLTFTLG